MVKNPLFYLKDSSHKRHIAKAITWRAVGTVDTILLSWWITGDPLVGLQIGLAEVITKMFFYYLHERLWFRINLNGKANWRHILKTVSWRLVGTIDTVLIAWLLSGNQLVGLKLGLVEILTKMILYYFHERAWYKVDYGLEYRRSSSKSITDE